MAAPQRGKVISTRLHENGRVVRGSIKVSGRETPLYVEWPARLGISSGDNVEVVSAPRGTKAKQNIGYKIKKI
ncbi:hypothetical protein KY335_02475 [Candidatus Woesearchaeota archaeon]|nr:hypothetical protein [Candidatus Woesearchaeota archaeon]MBW3014084.1 hypothetical protein [Candidatus Woesearchaeota archaeon]